MKTNWERHQSIIHLPDEAIRSIVKSYQPHLKVNTTSQLSGGLSHTNYKIDIAHHSSVVIRVARNQESLKREYEVHRSLPKEVRAPAFLHMTKWNGYHIGILEWKEGSLLRDHLSTSSQQHMKAMGQSIGEQLASMRELRFYTYGFLDSTLEVRDEFQLTPTSFISTIESFFNHHASKWLSLTLIDRVMSFVRNNAYLLEQDQSEPRLVHGDYNGLNVLMDGTEVSAVLDWEFALSGSIYFDLGNMIRYEFDHMTSFKEGIQQGLLKRGITLPKQWQKLAKLADLVALCSLLDRPVCGKNRVIDITQLITKTIESY
ncbi:phosphotransferase family protein [Guptibacillus hwajinpoensis]|uniref:phosphotransferase family protein n=1 Tax=Guptibacillus hwajinpoensis TaxID=208199 RepID=UPI00273EEC07|nr:phosphotransferase [Pseudalkalibacillus hwajinpoensis]WLR60026.1 phosphotransferase [Pseudalkalibacillus hwajinpoensis]